MVEEGGEVIHSSLDWRPTSHAGRDKVAERNPLGSQRWGGARSRVVVDGEQEPDVELVQVGVEDPGMAGFRDEGVGAGVLQQGDDLGSREPKIDRNKHGPDPGAGQIADDETDAVEPEVGDPVARPDPVRR